MKRILPILLLSLAVVAYRVAAGTAGGGLAAHLANFTPLAALALLLGVYLKRPSALGLIAGVQIVSDLVLAAIKKADVSVVYLVVPVLIYAAIAFAGPRLRRHFSLVKSLLGVAGAAVAFHIIANTLSFAMDPSYAKSFGGWIQAQTVGLPGFPPSYLFLIKSLIGNLAFTVVFFLACGTPQASALPANALRALAKRTSDEDADLLHA